MAEARSAVRSLSVELRLEDVEEGKSAWRDIFRDWRKGIVRQFYRTRNLLRNRTWPTSTYNLAVGVGVISASLIYDWPLVQPMNRWLWAFGNALHIKKDWPYNSGIIVVSFAGGVTFFITLLYTRRFLLRIFLAYRGWMYEDPHRHSHLSLMWGRALWLVSGYHPTTYSCQKSLPRLPVPPLDVTIHRFLGSVKPLYGEDSEEYRRFVKHSEEFKQTIGPKLQRMLVLKSWWSSNWVTDWWEKYVYLHGRTPLPINSNYYALDHAKWCPTPRQLARAASTIYQYMQWKRGIDRETLPPLLIRNMIPLCMSQYERLFSTTRIPGYDRDKLARYETSKHIVVMRKGIYYKLMVFDKKGQLLTPRSLEKQLEFIMNDADEHIEEFSEAAKSLAALTASNRTQWAKMRKQHFNSGLNKQSLDIVESAIFHVVLDTHQFDTWTEQGKYLLHGDGTTFWFDKSFTALFFTNGKMGLNAEHSWGDAPVIGHLSENNLTTEGYNALYDAEGRPALVTDVTQAPVYPVERLHWQVNASLQLSISNAVTFAQSNNADLDLYVVEHDDYGKGFIKTCKVSPDAYVQMALQLAYVRDSGGRFALTYESTMTRLYLLGRTETVRPLTSHSAEFVRSMDDSTKTNAERIALLRVACDEHQRNYRLAMNGEGFDRHLFGLYILSKGLDYESDFLHEALMLPWTLSTSQQPQQQIAGSPRCSELSFQDKICPGGGFGPVTDDGYGVSYMVPGDHRLYFHVSSKVSSPKTDSKRFVGHLFESFRDMKKIFDK